MQNKGPRGEIAMKTPVSASKCPICELPQPEDERAHRPFCSARCRMIDLGNWLGGSYTVAGEPSWEDPSTWDENVH